MTRVGSQRHRKRKRTMVERHSVTDCKDCPTKDRLMNANNSVVAGRKMNAIRREWA
jgi:hypothetical protein